MAVCILRRQIAFLRQANFPRRFVVVSSESPHQSEESEVTNKVVYNSIINRLSYVSKRRADLKLRNKIRAEAARVHLTPVSLKYLLNTEEEQPAPEPVSQAEADVVLPYSSSSVHEIQFVDKPEAKTKKTNDDSVINEKTTYARSCRRWMNDYEKYTGPEELPEEAEDWRRNYGTADPQTPVSQVPCGGCGALLHCQNPSIPGYLPSEIFKMCNQADLRGLTCQRCHFMKNYNTALSVSVNPELYPKLLSTIKEEKALVILMVDLTDFPCSIWPGILDVIGWDKPLVLVGNKVDLLWGDRKGWLSRTAQLLKSNLPKKANIQAVHLISAKTGFGVERLINKLHEVWGYKGDVYLIGCTNVGKSTLFNALLQSDYCKVKAADLLQKATTAPWPGTTLNLLKFPILRPEGWRLYLRMSRLTEEKKDQAAEQKLKRNLSKINSKETTPLDPPQLIGHVGRTFSINRDPNDGGSFTLADASTVCKALIPGSGLDPTDEDFAHGKWLMDTPGVLHRDQILDLLTTEEIVELMPTTPIAPRTYRMRPGWTLFIGGLARLDFLDGTEPARWTVYAAPALPVTICGVDAANEVYTEWLGTDNFRIPSGGESRLKLWPGLECGNSFKLSGLEKWSSCADVVLSSAGWISITPDKNSICELRPWTPNARGIHVRVPSLLPFGVTQRGKRHRNSPAYGKSCAYTREEDH